MERIKNDESTIFLAMDESKKQGLGFVQSYPCFSSVALEKIWILNDLFVSSNARGQGVAQKLIQHTIDFSEQSGANRIELKTINENLAAKKLYEKLEFYKQDGFTHYWWLHKEAYPVKKL